jgi:hypothetical protein
MGDLYSATQVLGTYPKNEPQPAPQGPTPRKSYTPQEAAQLGLGWVDQYNPNWGKAGFVGSELSSPSGPSSTPGSAGPSGPITTQQQIGDTTATNGGAIAQGAPTTVAQSFQQALINRLNPTPVNASSASIAPAIQANQLAEQRGMERSRNLLAERSAADGTSNSGGFDAQLLGLMQNRAQREGQFAGNAVQQGQALQDADTRAFAGMAGSLLSGNANLGQQMNLANLDAELRRAGLAQQGQLGNADIALRGQLGQGQLQLGLLSALLQNDQFGKSLGQNAAQFGAGLDLETWKSLFGG